MEPSLKTPLTETPVQRFSEEQRLTILLNSSMSALTTSVSDTETFRLQAIRLAVLSLINMNDMLYSHLGSAMFDVPHIDKIDILLKTKLLHKQRDDYINIFINHRDYKFHQKQLDMQILTNRRLRQYVKDARELFADKQNLRYGRRMFKTDTIFPDAAKRKLPKTLPLTYVCDHLLNVCHYMHNARIAEVINELIAEQEQNTSLPKATDKTHPPAEPRSSPSIIGHKTLVVQTGKNTPVTASVKHVPGNKSQNVGRRIPDLQHTVTQQTSCVISDTDLVGQILQLGLESKNKKPISRRLCSSSYVRDINAGSFCKPLQTAQSDAEFINKPGVTIDDSITAKGSLGKPLGSKSACMTGEKRTRDTLSEEVQREINSKRLRTVEWLEEQALLSRNKHLPGSKTKATLIAKSRKDHATRHEMTKTKQLQPIKLSLKKCDSNWTIIKSGTELFKRKKIFHEHDVIRLISHLAEGSCNHVPTQSLHISFIFLNFIVYIFYVIL